MFSDDGGSWSFEGTFSVSEIEEKYVVLSGGYSASVGRISVQDENQYQEGGKKYVAHLMAERNLEAVKSAKEALPWECDICALDFFTKYGVPYIEAHHKIPISTYSSRHFVKQSDFALLCPNCHKAVHIYMKKEGLVYEQAKSILRSIEA